jgi:hypothetical protein
MLDARELARIALEQPRVAVAAAGGATAAHVRPAASPGVAAALQFGGAVPGAAMPGPPPAGPPVSGRPVSGPPAQDHAAARFDVAAPEPAEATESLPAGGHGAEDFRAVAPPIMSFAQGRRR